MDLKNEKPYKIIYESEKVADKVLTNNRIILDLSKKREGVRQAINALKKQNENKGWISVSGMMTCAPKETCLDVLKKEQATLDEEINMLRDQNKLLVKTQSDLEKKSISSGFDLKPLSNAEKDAFKQNLPWF